MIEIPTAIFWIALTAAALAAFILGWDFAVHNHRRTRKTLETNVADLEAQVASFRDDMDRDPQRAWINLGKRNVLNQMENTMRTIRAALEPDA